MAERARLDGRAGRLSSIVSSHGALQNMPIPSTSVRDMHRSPLTQADLDDAGLWCLGVIPPPGAGIGWTLTRVPGMEWTSRQVVDHLCNTLAFYANHVVMQAGEHQPRIRTLGENDLSDRDLSKTVGAWVRLLGDALRAAPDDLLAWHPRGLTDVEGFLALACNELVVHASDVARAHAESPAPPTPDFCRRLLARLFPVSPLEPREDPWQVLLWANGRPSRAQRPAQASWMSHPQPLRS